MILFLIHRRLCQNKQSCKYTPFSMTQIRASRHLFGADFTQKAKILLSLQQNLERAMICSQNQLCQLVPILGFYPANKLQVYVKQLHTPVTLSKLVSTTKTFTFSTSKSKCTHYTSRIFGCTTSTQVSKVGIITTKQA